MASLSRDASSAGSDAVAIGPSRVRWASIAVFFAVLGAVGGARAITAGSATGIVLVVLIVGPLLGFSVRLAVMRRPLIVIGDDGFTDGRSGRMIPWDAVEEI